MNADRQSRSHSHSRLRVSLPSRRRRADRAATRARARRGQARPCRIREATAAPRPGRCRRSADRGLGAAARSGRSWQKAVRRCPGTATSFRLLRSARQRRRGRFATSAASSAVLQLFVDISRRHPRHHHQHPRRGRGPGDAPRPSRADSVNSDGAASFILNGSTSARDSSCRIGPSCARASLRTAQRVVGGRGDRSATSSTRTWASSNTCHRRREDVAVWARPCPCSASNIRTRNDQRFGITPRWWPATPSDPSSGSRCAALLDDWLIPPRR